MALHPTRVYRYRLRSILRRRWTDYLLLVLLIGLVGGLAMGSVVAGRRTQSAYASFLRQHDASTLTMSSYGVYTGSSANLYFPAVEAAIRRLPEVAEVQSWLGVLSGPIGPDGAPVAAAGDAINVAGSVDGLFFDEDRVAVIKGRMANPAAPNEFMTSELGARALGFHVGQSVPFGIYTLATATSPGFGTPAVQPDARVTMRLVGIIQFDNTVLQDDTDHFPTNLVLTPAFTRTQETQGYGTWYAVRLKPGVKDIGRVEQQLVRQLPPGSAPNFSLTSATEAKVESALRPESIALGVFGLIAALAALGICLPIAARLLVNSEDEREVLRALGAPRSSIAADYYVGVAASVIFGTALACVVSAALGSFAPLGPVRTVYHPGRFAPDWTVTATGAALLVGGVAGAAVVMALRRSGPRRAGAGGWRTPPSSRAVDAAARIGLPAPAVVGARFALESGRGPTSVPTRSVLVSAAVSVSVVVATLTFASGLRTLVNRPALYGWDWGYTLSSTNGVPPAALDALKRDPAVEAWTGYTAVSVTIDGHSVPTLIADTAPTVAPPVLTGHRVTGPGQIILGRATLAALHSHVGGTVQFGYGSPSTAPLYLPPQPMRVVGTGTFPAVAGASTFADHTSMGIGALLSFDSVPESFRGQTKNPDPVQAGPPLVFVRYRPGTRSSAAAADIRRVIGIANRQFAGDPLAATDTVEYLPVQRPAAIVNYQSTGATPFILASGLAVGAIAALALSMVASVKRRRRDLAVLKTLGFVRSQMMGAVVAQALVTVLLAVAVGLPVGIAAGRQLWIAFARNIDAVPQPTVPGSVALVALAAVLIAVAVAVLPGRLAARTPAGAVLRAD